MAENYFNLSCRSFLVGGLVFAGYKIGQRQIQLPPQPTLIPIPKATDALIQQMTPSPSGKREVIISAKDDDGQVMLGVGETLVLSLGSNPTTGYRWEIAEIDEAVLKLTHYEYQARPPPPPRFWGTRYLVFQG